MSADEDGLVRALFADPWDELARNAYADWLDDHDAPLHAALMRAGNSPVRAGLYKSLRGRLHQTFSQFALDVITPSWLLGALMPTSTFLSPHFQSIGAEWLQSNHVAYVGLGGPAYDCRDTSRQVARSHLTPHLRGLHLSGPEICVAAEALASADCFGSLASLAIRQQEGLAGLVPFVSPRALPRLVGLTLELSEVGHLQKQGETEDCLRLLGALAHGPLAGQLEHLDLRGCHLGDRAVAQLALSGALLAGLVALRLGGPGLSDLGIEALLASPHLGRLRSLDIGGGRIGDKGLAALAGSGLLPRLGWLSLLGNRGGSPRAYLELARPAANVPGLRLELGAHPAECRDEVRGLLGARLVE